MAPVPDSEALATTTVAGSFWGGYGALETVSSSKARVSAGTAGTGDAAWTSAAVYSIRRGLAIVAAAVTDWDRF